MKLALKNQITTAMLFFCLASLMLGYELGVNLIQGFRVNGLLVVAACCSLYGYRLLVTALKTAELPN